MSHHDRSLFLTVRSLEQCIEDNGVSYTEELYNIELYEDGGVFDITEERDFVDLGEWVDFVNENEEPTTTYEKFHKIRYDEDE